MLILTLNTYFVLINCHNKVYLNVLKAQFEKIPISYDSSFYAFLYENNSFSAPWHFHPEYELTYILKGEGIRYVGNSVQEFKAGDFVLLGANLSHCWKDVDTCNEGVKSIVFQWNDSVLGENWYNKDEFKNIKKLLNNSLQGIKFNNFETSTVSNNLITLLNKPPLEKLLSFIQLLENLSLKNDFELLTYEGFLPNLNRKANDRMDAIYNYVHKNYDTKITLKNVSSIVSMSEEAFCRFFKKSLNKTFFLFVNEYRINRACKLLIDTNKQVKQIAYKCGYESLPFFYRQFQKFIKCSPLEYRSKHIASKTLKK